MIADDPEPGTRVYLDAYWVGKIWRGEIADPGDQRIADGLVLVKWGTGYCSVAAVEDLHREH